MTPTKWERLALKANEKRVQAIRLAAFSIFNHRYRYVKPKTEQVLLGDEALRNNHD